MTRLSLLILTLLLTGCNAPKFSAANTPVDLSQDVQGIQDASSGISTHAGRMRTALESAPKDDTHGRADEMLAQMQQIAADLSVVAGSLTETKAALEAAEKARQAEKARFEKEIADLKDAERAKWSALWNWVRAASSLAAIGAAAFGFFVSPKGFSIAVFCGGVAAFATFMLGVGMLVVSLIGGGAVLVLVAGVVYERWQARKKQEIEDRAMSDLGEMAADMLDASKPETAREFIAAANTRYPAFRDGFTDRHERNKYEKSAVAA